MSIVTFKRRMEAVKYSGGVYEDLDLRSTKAFSSTWLNCTFRRCQMSLSDLRQSRFEGCVFDHCEAPLTNFTGSFFEDCAFTACNLEQASFMGAFFRNVTFEDCRMAYGDAMFQDATVKANLSFTRCNLHGSSLDFREVTMRELHFTDSNLWSAKVSLGCPVFNCTADERLQKQFLALVARVRENPAVEELAGEQMRVVNRIMDAGKKT